MATYAPLDDRDRLALRLLCEASPVTDTATRMAGAETVRARSETRHLDDATLRSILQRLEENGVIQRMNVSSDPLSRRYQLSSATARYAPRG